MEETLFSVAFTAYTVGMALYLGYAITKKENLSNLGKWLLVVGVVCHIISFIVRTIDARQIPQHNWYVPWSNWYESFSFFSLIITIEFLYIQ